MCNVIGTAECLVFKDKVHVPEVGINVEKELFMS